MPELILKIKWYALMQLLIHSQLALKYPMI